MYAGHYAKTSWLSHFHEATLEQLLSNFQNYLHYFNKNSTEVDIAPAAEKRTLMLDSTLNHDKITEAQNLGQGHRVIVPA